MIVSASDLKNAFGKYLNLVLVEGEITITKNNRPIAKMVSCVSNEPKQEEKEENINS